MSLNFFSIGIIESSECVEPIICCSFVLNMNTISCDCILMFFHLTGMSVKYVTTVEYWTSVVSDSKLSYTANSKAHAGKLKAWSFRSIHCGDGHRPWKHINAITSNSTFWIEFFLRWRFFFLLHFCQF